MMQESSNPLNMIPDPYDGATFVFPETDCTEERKLFFRRINEIQAFLFITKLSLDEYNKNFKSLIPKMPFKEKTPIKIESVGGKSITMNASQIPNLTTEGINILTRQVFVMYYGSFETYLFQLFERTFPQIGIRENTLDSSIEILMRRKWDSKFQKMSEVFDLNFKAGFLMDHFSGFELNFEGKIFKNPLTFLDELAQIRHRIVHASSILDKDKLINLDMNAFHDFFAFFFLLTDFVDNLFATRFKYERVRINPATV